MHSLARPLALSGSDQALVATRAILHGYSVRETGGAATATVRLFDNASAASGTLLATISLAAGGSADVLYPAGLLAENGIYVDMGGTGTVEGSVRIG
jgi:hypothetical protein